MSKIQCLVYSIQCPVFRVQYPVSSIQCPVSSVQYAVSSIHYTLSSTQCTVFSIQCPVSTAQNPRSSIQCPVSTFQYLLSGIQCLVSTVQCPVSSALYPVSVKWSMLWSVCVECCEGQLPVDHCMVTAFMETLALFSCHYLGIDKGHTSHTQIGWSGLFCRAYATLIFWFIKVIPGREQPGLMQWILFCIMPLLQDHSSDLLTCSLARYYFAVDILFKFRMKERHGAFW